MDHIYVAWPSNMLAWWESTDGSSVQPGFTKKNRSHILPDFKDNDIFFRIQIPPNRQALNITTWKRWQYYTYHKRYACLITRLARTSFIPKPLKKTSRGNILHLWRIPWRVLSDRRERIELDKSGRNAPANEHRASAYGRIRCTSNSNQ